LLKDTEEIITFSDNFCGQVKIIS